MDPNKYKDFTTSRGLKYHYYFHAPTTSKPTLLLLHGFPSLSTSWVKQVPFFEQHGFGLIVPDLLGYGGTDKPYDPAMYRLKAMAQDIVELLDWEKVDKVVSIGHDWGSALNSRLAVYFQTRFVAFAVLAAGYMAPNPDFDVHVSNAATEKILGRPLFGYWLFYNEDDCYELISAHILSSFSLAFADDPKLWATHLAPIGAFKEWILTDKKTKIASWMTEEEKQILLEETASIDYRAATCWYKCPVRKLNNSDEKEIPLEKYTINKPLFFGAALKDEVCVASFLKVAVHKYCSNATVVDFDSDHWLPLSASQKVNEELFKWLGELQVA